MQVIRATDICDGLMVDRVPSLLSSASSWLSVTNSASRPTRSPSFGSSSSASGVNITWRRLGVTIEVVSSRTDDVTGLTTGEKIYKHVNLESTCKIYKIAKNDWMSLVFLRKKLQKFKSYHRLMDTRKYVDTSNVKNIG